MTPTKPPTVRWNQQDIDAWQQWIDLVHQVKVRYEIEQSSEGYGPVWDLVAYCFVDAPGEPEHTELLTSVRVRLTNQFAVNVWELMARCHGKLLVALNELLGERFEAP